MKKPSTGRKWFKSRPIHCIRPKTSSIWLTRNSATCSTCWARRRTSHTLRISPNSLTSDFRTINTLVSEFDKLLKNWNILEPIFKQSSNVKANLAETSSKFEGVNNGFKELINEMRVKPTVKEVCVVEGCKERVKELFIILDSCETVLTA